MSLSFEILFFLLLLVQPSRLQFLLKDLLMIELVSVGCMCASSGHVAMLISHWISYGLTVGWFLLVRL